MKRNNENSSVVDESLTGNVEQEHRTLVVDLN
jgi:hypothetical protein